MSNGIFIVMVRRTRRLFLALALMGVLPPAIGHAQSGVTVIDARTLRVGGITYRLYGIDAPDLDQTCTDRRGRTYPCGAIARTAMLDLAAGVRVACTPVAGAQPAIRALTGDKPIPARCRAGSFDIGGNMVHTGWALADPKTAPPHYRRIEARSRKSKHGLWRGAFEAPWAWRRRSAVRRGKDAPARDAK